MKFSNGARALSGEAQVVPVVLSLKEMKEKFLAQHIHSTNIFLDNSLYGGLLVYGKPDRIRVVFLSLDQLCPFVPTQPSSLSIENGIYKNSGLIRR